MTALLDTLLLDRAAWTMGLPQASPTSGELQSRPGALASATSWSAAYLLLLLPYCLLWPSGGFGVPLWSCQDTGVTLPAPGLSTPQPPLPVSFSAPASL